LIWAFLLRGKPRKRQISVLLSRQHWHDALLIARNIPLMLLGKRPLPQPGNALSRVFEMLGLLTMSAMAVTGSIIWSLWAGPGNQVPALAEIVMEIHAAIAILLFCYLAGHVSMALMHARAGDSVFTRILPQLTRNSAQEKCDSETCNPN
ncbi:MAG: cytochrome b/b6 domain-containing protein, partial [Mariprofundaceae bacterium]|nr:cytochrome b/b6 domain-containing protein [Mariprofundaceae bacterium]